MDSNEFEGIWVGFAERTALRAHMTALETMPSLQELLADNRAIAAELENVAGADELSDLAMTHGVRWALMRPEDVDKYRWPDAVLKNPVYSSRGYAVYDMFEPGSRNE